MAHIYLASLVNNSVWLIFLCVSDDVSCNETHCSHICNSLLLRLYKRLPESPSAALKEQINCSTSLEPQPKSANISVKRMCGEGALCFPVIVSVRHLLVLDSHRWSVVSLPAVKETYIRFMWQHQQHLSHWEKSAETIASLFSTTTSTAGHRHTELLL